MSLISAAGEADSRRVAKVSWEFHTEGFGYYPNEKHISLACVFQETAAVAVMATYNQDQLFAPVI